MDHINNNRMMQQFLPPRFRSRVETIPQSGDREFFNTLNDAIERNARRGDANAASLFAELQAHLIERRRPHG